MLRPPPPPHRACGRVSSLQPPDPLSCAPQELSRNQQLFIQHGSYLLIERAKIITYRNFFKRVADLQGGPSKLDLKLFLRCLSAIGMDMDMDEVECVLANLIYAGYIKGYISHQHGKLVVSKGNAFPELSAVQGGK